jgi:hypothetical protein
MCTSVSRPAQRLALLCGLKLPAVGTAASNCYKVDAIVVLNSCLHFCQISGGSASGAISEGSATASQAGATVPSTPAGSAAARIATATSRRRLDRTTASVQADSDLFCGRFALEDAPSVSAAQPAKTSPTEDNVPRKLFSKVQRTPILALADVALLPRTFESHLRKMASVQGMSGDDCHAMLTCLRANGIDSLPLRVHFCM